MPLAKATKVALVQYTANTNIDLFEQVTPEVRQQMTDENVRKIHEALRKAGLKLEALEPMLVEDGYRMQGEPLRSSHFVPLGMRVFAPAELLDDARLLAEEARGLCEALKVDAVIAVSETWGARLHQFWVYPKHRITITAYGRDGEPVWRDRSAESANGPITLFTQWGDLAPFVLLAKNSVHKSVEVLTRRLQADLAVAAQQAQQASDDLKNQ